MNNSIMKNSCKNKLFRIIILLILMLTLSSCLHRASYLLFDHTVGAITRPITTSSELLWRVQAYTKASLLRYKIKFFNFPLMENIPISNILPDREFMNQKAMTSWLNNYVGEPLACNLKLIKTGEGFFKRLTQCLKEAIKSIDINIYIFDNDIIGMEIANILKEKSKTIAVKVLLDIIGSRNAWQKDPKKIMKRKDFRKCKRKTKKKSKKSRKNILNYLKENSKVKAKRSRNLLFTSNHIKSVIIDKRYCFFGGMNFGYEYRYTWRDLMIEVEGPVIEKFNQKFRNSWRRSKLFSGLIYLFSEERKRQTQFDDSEKKYKCHFLVTTPYRRQIYKAQIHAAQNAKHHIYIENPYCWDYKFIYYLCEARKRGVDVRVTLPLRSDIHLWNNATRSAINTLLHHGVRVFIFPTMTHVKAAVYDGWSCFGTANFDDLSFHKNYEINLSTYEKEITLDLEEFLLEGQQQAKEVTTFIQKGFMDDFWLIAGIN